MSDSAPAAAGTADPAATDPAAGPAGFSHRQIMTALSGLLLAVLVGALDQTIVATAMRTIADQLHGETVQAWATTGYLVSSTIAMPFYGKLSDLYGRKPLYLAAIAVFLVGSAGCGLAHSMIQLAVFRVIQGLGGAGLMSLPTAIVADLAPARERGRYFAHLQIAWVAAGLLGPLIGGGFAGAGSLLGVTGWRWAFLVNLPLGLIALVTVRRALNLPHPRSAQRLDLRGAAALALGLVPLLIVAAQGLSWGWASTPAIVMYLLGGLGLVLFVLVERGMGDAAMLPVRLFRRGGITLCLIAALTVGAGIFGVSTIIPLFLQLVQNRTPAVAGLALVPFMAGSIIAATAGGKVISATGRYKALAVLGLGLMAGPLLAFATADARTPLWLVALLSLLVGLGIGLATQVLTLAVQTAAPAADLGAANGAAGLSRQLGGTAGVAVFLSVIFGVTIGRVGSHVDLNDTSFLRHLDPGRAAPLRAAFTAGFQRAFLLGGLVLLAGFVLTWFFRELSTADDPGSGAGAEPAGTPADAPTG